MDSPLEKLNTIRSKHCQDKKNCFQAWLNAITKYTKISSTGIIDIASTAVNLTANYVDKNPDVHPLALKAIRDTNPNFDINQTYSLQELKGITNSSKGKFFEYLVQEKLNSGERVGNIVLPNGYKAEVASNMNQTGWDLKIVDQSGNIEDYLQLKATNSIGYVKEALEKYPETKILATSEIADQAFEQGIVIDSDVSNSWLESSMEQAIKSGEVTAEQFLEIFSPLFSLATIAGTEGYQIIADKKDIQSAINSASTRVGKSLISNAVGGLVYSLGGGLLSIPSGVLTRLILERMDYVQVTCQVIENSRIELLQLRLLQQNQKLIGDI